MIVMHMDEDALEVAQIFGQRAGRKGKTKVYGRSHLVFHFYCSCLVLIDSPLHGIPILVKDEFLPSG
jgi:hypothetical protein